MKMKMKNVVKTPILICLLSYSFTLAMAEYTDTEINHVLRINGPIFLRTSEEFAPDKMQYLAADINGNAYNIESNPIIVTFTGIENFHGNFLPAKAIFLENEHQFVGHATLPINAGRITVRIGESEKSYRMRDHDAIIKDTIIVNNSIYELSIMFSQELRKDVLFKNDPDKARATTYFITIDEIKWISYTPEHAGRIDRLKDFEEKEQIIRETAKIIALQKTNEKAFQKTSKEKSDARRARHR